MGLRLKGTRRFWRRFDELTRLIPIKKGLDFYPKIDLEDMK